jgi:cold shock CspA family protein
MASSAPPARVDLPSGTKVLFQLGRNNLGPIGVKVRRLNKEASAVGWVLGMKGTLSSDRASYGFILGEDGNTYFVSYSDFLNPHFTKSNLVGAQLEFDVSPEMKGRYPSAKFVKILE